MDDLLNQTLIAYVWLGASLALVVLGVICEAKRLSRLNWLIVAGGLSAMAWGTWNIHPTIMALRHGSDAPGLRFALERSRKELLALKSEHKALFADARSLEVELSTQTRSRADDAKQYATSLLTASVQIAAEKLERENQTTAARSATRRLHREIAFHEATRQRAHLRRQADTRMQAIPPVTAESSAMEHQHLTTPGRVGPISSQVQKCRDAIESATKTNSIKFSSASASPTAESAITIARIAGEIRKCPNVKILVEGHTDSVDTTGQNAILSQKRATTVLEQLIATGINRAQLDAKGFGAARLIVAPEITEADREVNRRIRFDVQDGPVVD